MMADGKENGKAAGSPDQHARFLGTALALGCDEDEAAFDEKLRAIAKPKPEGGPAPKPGKLSGSS